MFFGNKNHTARIKAPGKKPILYLLCVMILLCACNTKSNEKRISEKLTLAGTDKQPMGGFVFKYLAKKSFINDDISTNINSFEKWHYRFLTDQENTTGNVYFIVAPRLLTYKDEALAMADFVETGNTLYVAANYFDPFFLEQFSLSLHDDLSILSTRAAFKMRDTKKHLTDSIIFNPRSFSFFFYPLQKSFSADSSKQFEVLGLNDFGSPDLIRIIHGKGQLIIMTNVQACTNYFLLTQSNHKYALASFSYLPNEPNSIYWDDFYRRYTTRTAEGKSIFSALLSIPSLMYTFWIIVAIAATWIITNIFRKQRIIPIRQANVNSSIEFTQTIARLYYNKKDNRNIALKMIAYLQDHVRNKYFINYTGINETFGQVLAAKTGLAPARMQALVDTIYQVQHNGTTDDSTLLILNEQIQEVMKTSQSLK